MFLLWVSFFFFISCFNPSLSFSLSISFVSFSRTKFKNSKLCMGKRCSMQNVTRVWVYESCVAVANFAVLKIFKFFQSRKLCCVRDSNLIYALETQNLFTFRLFYSRSFSAFGSLCSDFELICTTSRTGQQFVQQWERKKSTDAHTLHKRKSTTKKSAAHLNFYSGCEAPHRIQKQRPANTHSHAYYRDREWEREKSFENWTIEEYGYYEPRSLLPEIKCAYLHCDEIYGHFFLKK